MAGLWVDPMNDSVLAYIASLFSNSWRLLETTIYPGTNLSLAVILLGSFLVVFSLRLLGNVFGFSSAQSGGNNKKIKVNSDREGDTH